MTLKTQEFRPTHAEVEAVLAALRDGQPTEHARVRKFEHEWAKVVGTRHCVTFNSGTTALYAGLMVGRARGLIKGTRIATNACSYPATANAIILAGLTPFFVDAAPGHFGGMDIGLLDEALSKGNIAAILAVHLFGVARDLDRLVDVSRRAGCLLIEDAAQAAGTRYRSRTLGSFGHFGVLSFDAAHQLQAGEMGAVTTDDADLAAALHDFKDNGRPKSTTWSEWFGVSAPGLDLKTTELAAALALAQLRGYEGRRAQRLAHARRMAMALRNSAAVESWIDFDDDACPFAFPITVYGSRAERDRVAQELAAAGIEGRPMFPCLPGLPTYRQIGEKARYPVATDIADRTLYVGCRQHLTPGDVTLIAESLIAAVRAERGS